MTKGGAKHDGSGQPGVECHLLIFEKNCLKSGMKIKPQSTSASRQAEAGWHRCPFQ
jgi:hypothetical protein